MAVQGVGATTEPTVTGLLLARSRDERPGLVFEDTWCSWEEHVQLSADRAAWLRSCRQPGPFHIGVLLDNVPEFSILLGAAALSGAVIVGLNPTRRGQELAADIAHTDCQVIVTEGKYRDLLDGLNLRVPEHRIWDVDTRTYLDVVESRAASPLAPPATTPDDLFMLIFTSGTSGAPKAVRCTHRKIASPAVSIAERCGLTQHDVAYLSMPLFHSNAMMAGWGPSLASGATMVFKRRFSASAFLDDIREYSATFANYVGKPLSYVLATPPRPDDADNPLRIAFGNEAADRDIRRFAERFACEVMDGFGSTEGGVGVGRTDDTPVGSIGRAMPGVAILSSETAEPCPPAAFGPGGQLLNAEEAIGELVNTGGRGAFEGYYKNEQAEAERLRNGWYWSGDLAYADENGFVYFAGRTLDWLRVDGENFAAAPVERVLERHPDVVASAVYAVPAADVGDEVMAALVLRAGAAFDPDGFAAFLAAQPDLGTKWAPRYVRVATTLPQTETNKVLKRALATEGTTTTDPVWHRPGRDLSYEPLSTTNAST
jgi:fatty-acyl-CoA synthase